MLLGQRGVGWLVRLRGRDDRGGGQGEVDAAAVRPPARWYFNCAIRSRPSASSTPTTRSRTALELAVGLRRADPPSARRSMRAIDRLMADGTVQKIYAPLWVEYSPPLRPTSPPTSVAALPVDVADRSRDLLREADPTFCRRGRGRWRRLVSSLRGSDRERAEISRRSCRRWTRAGRSRSRQEHRDPPRRASAERGWYIAPRYRDT
jgi:hypothetical protein